MPVFPTIPIIGGLIGSQLAVRAPSAFMHVSRTGQAWQAAKGFFPSGQFGIGYTGGAYAGYGVTNTWDPFGLHRPKYKYYTQKLGLAYSRYYPRRYSRYGRFYRRRRYRYQGRRSYYRRYY